MERVSTLLKKLQKQVDDNSPAIEMLQTVQILQSELINKIENKQPSGNKKISVVMPLCLTSPQLSSRIYPRKK